jgi:chymotrypsin
MKLLVALLFVFLAVSAYAEEEAEWVEIDWSKVVPVTEIPGFWDGREIKAKLFPDTNTRSSRIVGGTIVAPNSIPFQAGLLINWSGGTALCGGSALSNRVVLTAAHCITPGVTSTQVILGAHQITANEPTQQRRTVQPSGFRIHGSYNPSNLNNDIATLILPTTVTATPQVQWVALPALGNTETFAGLTATASGWGRTSDGSTATSSHLRSVQNTIITNAVCQQTYGSGLLASMLCMATTGGRGTCRGDSGGPLTIARNGRLQVGVVSFGSSAGCQRGFPAGFSRVTSFRQWISNNMSKVHYGKLFTIFFVATWL